MNDYAKDMILGLAVGDAVGVPYEFRSRAKMDRDPAEGTTGYGTHNQPPGTWSDDSSLTFCLVEAMTEGYSLEHTARNFIRWKEDAWWSAHGAVFDIGNTTARAIYRLSYILESGDITELNDLAKYATEQDNGNGALMRTAPLLFEIWGRDIVDQWEIVLKNSALTHGHIRSAMACMICLKVMEHMTRLKGKYKAYTHMKDDIFGLWDSIGFPESERMLFARIMYEDVHHTKREAIKSDGYVIHTLEAALWCFLGTTSYESAILTAVNLGKDTDTTAAVTGALAGIQYSTKGIPNEWVNALARKEDILNLISRFNETYKGTIEWPTILMSQTIFTDK